jgi:hypothetical protein
VITYGILCVRSDGTVFYMDLSIIILQLSIKFNFLYLCFYLSVKPAFKNCIISIVCIDFDTFSSFD